MKRSVLFSSIIIAAIVSTSLITFAGNGNGPQSGSGGNAQNKGKAPTAWIYHKHGNGTWSLMQVPVGAIGGHAAHGDMWYKTGCPLDGPEYGCN